MKLSKKRTKYAALFCLLLAAAGVFCLFSSELQRSAARALSICASSVVPSLFPFMVISSLLTQSAPYLFGEEKVRSFFGLPPSALVAVILGCVCGFPVGTVTAAGLKRRGLLTKSQAARLAAVSNNAGPAFVVGVIGGSFWGSRAIGLKLYLLQLLSAAIIAPAFLALSAKNGARERANANRAPIAPRETRMTVIFTEAVGQATLGVLRVCGFVVFFSVLVDGAAVAFPSLPGGAFAALACVLEFTSGCRLAAAIGGRIGFAMCAFAIGFSGVSVMAQSAAFAAAEDFGLRETVVFKLIAGLLCAVLAYFVL